MELVTGSYGTRCNAEPARGVLDFDPWPAYVSEAARVLRASAEVSVDPHAVRRRETSART